MTRDPHAPCDVDARPSGGLPQERDLLRKQAEQVAPEESRTQSERLRETLRFSVAAPGGRRVAIRDRFIALMDAVQDRTRGGRPGDIRKLVREAGDAAHRGTRRVST